MDDLLTLFKDIKKILDKNNMHYCLIYGALLGMVRNKKLIEADTDIDLGAWDIITPIIHNNIEQFHKKNITVHFSESGHITLHRNKKHVSIMIFSRSGKNAERFTYTHMRKANKPNLSTITQLFKYMRWVLMKPRYVGDSPKFVSNHIQKIMIKISYSLPDTLAHFFKKCVEIILSSGCNYFVERMSAKYLDDLIKIDFYGSVIDIPKDSEKYLEFKYGTDWKIPKKDYIYYKDSKSEVRIA